MKDSHESYLTSFYMVMAFRVFLLVFHTLCHFVVRQRILQAMYFYHAFYDNIQSILRAISNQTQILYTQFSFKVDILGF